MITARILVKFYMRAMLPQVVSERVETGLEGRAGLISCHALRDTFPSSQRGIDASTMMLFARKCFTIDLALNW